MSQGQRRSPLFILSEDSERTRGSDAQSSNITAGTAVAESVRTTLGPQGMDKMLVGDTGDVVITNDGVTILQEMDIDHPAAQLVVEAAESQEDSTGDGTTTAAVLTGQLLGEAETLIDREVHPRTIVDGYAEATRIAHETLDDLAVTEGVDDEVLAQVARTSMTGKGTGEFEAEGLADLVVEAVRRVRGPDGDVRRDDVSVVAEMGAASSATELVEGLVLDTEPARDGMARRVDDATVMVLDAPLEKRETAVDVEYNVGGSAQMDAALEAEVAEFREYAETLAEAGVDVLVTTDDVEDYVLDFLDDYGIVVFDDVGGFDGDDSSAVARAVGATSLGTVEAVAPEHLGHAESIRVERYGDETYTVVDGGPETGVVTLFVRGGTAHVAEEVERAIGDALDVVATALGGGGVVPGAGVSEIKVASRLRDEAAGISGRRQLAVEAFADAIEALPRTLAENTGLDQIDALVDLRAGNEGDGVAGVISRGETGEIGDPTDDGVFDPAQVKRSAIDNASETASVILRIDDIISSD